MPAGIGVVAQVGDAIFGQQPTTDLQDLFSDWRGYPRVDSVADDVVKGRLAFAEVEDVLVSERQIPNSELLDFPLDRKSVV